MNSQSKQQLYDIAFRRVQDLIAEETDLIAVMATVVCELHHAFDHFDWTGFYRVVEPGVLKIGPYQGTHGCLTISFERGVCGAAARSGETQVVPDVHEFPGHIACSSLTRSEIVVPVTTPDGALVAVLDVDSDRLGAFDEVDKVNLERICLAVGAAGRQGDAPRIQRQSGEMTHSI
jgi:L-methionine (R)-S-oxide reductase